MKQSSDSYRIYNEVWASQKKAKTVSCSMSTDCLKGIKSSKK